MKIAGLGPQEEKQKIKEEVSFKLEVMKTAFEKFQREHGLCLRCGSRYGPNHKCLFKK